MRDYLNVTVKLTSAALVMAFVSACTSVGTPRQLAEAEAVNRFDESRGPVGIRLAAARDGYSPRLYGLNPYFGR